MAVAAEAVIPRTELLSFVSRCMTSVGVQQRHAADLAELLVAADYRGHYSHGLNRLDMYVTDIKSKMCSTEGEPQILKETPATAWVDGANMLGPTVGRFCMDIAIQKAKQVGVGWVCAKGSNHFGIAGWYSMRAADEGLVGMAYTNTSPLVVPTRAKTPLLGTNPISVAAPGTKGDSYVLDMATSTVALGKVELSSRKQQPIPNGWAVDKDGKETNDPGLAEALLPVGGSELTGGYKGYGLGMMVELFCGLMAGSEYGPNIRRWKDNTKVANLGQCFIAVNPDMFAPGLPDRMQSMMDTARGMAPAEGEDEVLVAGDPERRHMSLCDERGGIPYHANQILYAENMAKTLGVEPPEILKK